MRLRPRTAQSAGGGSSHAPRKASAWSSFINELLTSSTYIAQEKERKVQEYFPFYHIRFCDYFLKNCCSWSSNSSRFHSNVSPVRRFFTSKIPSAAFLPTVMRSGNPIKSASA